MAKEVKTNAVRFLERAKVDFQFMTYESEGFLDGVSVAQKLGQPLEKTFKTLVTKGKSGQFFVFVIPVAKELDLKAAAKAVSEKSVEMIPVKDITAITGYVRGGCSPIGMKKQFVTVLDESAREQQRIMFSGGRLGMQIEMCPVTLAKLIRAEFAPITL